MIPKYATVVPSVTRNIEVSSLVINMIADEFNMFLAKFKDKMNNFVVIANNDYEIFNNFFDRFLKESAWNPDLCYTPLVLDKLVDIFNRHFKRDIEVERLIDYMFTDQFRANEMTASIFESSFNHTNGLFKSTKCIARMECLIEDFMDLKCQEFRENKKLTKFDRYEVFLEFLFRLKMGKDGLPTLGKECCLPTFMFSLKRYMTMWDLFAITIGDGILNSYDMRMISPEEFKMPMHESGGCNMLYGMYTYGLSSYITEVKLRNNTCKLTN